MTQNENFADFPSSFRGPVLRPGTPGYAEARAIHNAITIDATPAVIAQAHDTPILRPGQGEGTATGRIMAISTARDRAPRPARRE